MSASLETLPKVAVLLASFNGAPFIADQIATIDHQSNALVEIHVRDDGSSDETAAVIDGLATANPLVSVVDPNGKPTGSAACNFLTLLRDVDLSEVQYIALADQDDLWISGKLARAIECLNATGAAGYSSNLFSFDTYGRRPPWVVTKHGQQKKYDHFFQGASAGCTYVLTRDAAVALQQWLPTIDIPEALGISHDWLIYAFVRHRRLGWFCDDVALILYRQHAGNVYGSQRGLSDLLSRIRLLRQAWYRRHILWIADQFDLTPEEQKLVKRIRRLSIIDRLWLIVNAGQFRRRPRDILMLQLALIAHIF